MATQDRIRKDDLDDDELDPPPSSSDNTGSILAWIFGAYAAVIGTIGLVYVVIVLCFLAVFVFVFCVFVTIFLTIASAVAKMPPPQPPAVVQPQPAPPFNQPNNPFDNKERPNPRPILPGLKEETLKGTWLSDMDEFDARVGFGQFGKKGKLGYGIKAGEADSAIFFNGQPNPHGLSLAPSAAVESSVKYRPGRFYKLFKASVACNDLDPGVAGPNQPMTFRVYGDGELLWVSDPVSRAGVKQDVRLGVFGVDVLELRVQCGDGKNARAIWLDPQVLK